MQHTKIYLLAISIIIIIFKGSINVDANADTLPVLAFDKQIYTPFSIATITLHDDSKNTNPSAVDTVKVMLRGRESVSITLSETDVDSGVFKASIKLTPNKMLYAGDVEIRRDEWLVAVYDTLIATAAEVRYNYAMLEFDREYYYIGTERAVIRLVEPDADRDPYSIDKVVVNVWSESDVVGLKVTLQETDRHTGIFEGTVEFAEGSYRGKDKLKIIDNDRITVRYTDDTLPKPARLGADGVTTVEIRLVDAHAIYGTGIEAKKRILVDETKVITQFGEDVKILSSGSRLAIYSELMNVQPIEQRFTYIVQVHDNDGFVEHITYLSASMQPNVKTFVTQSWTPMKKGYYTIEVFVWDSIEKPVALSEVKVIRVLVS